MFAFTIGGQNDWSFSRCHESLDGSEETNIIVKYNIDLREHERIKPEQTCSTCSVVSVSVWLLYLFKQNEWCGLLSARWHRLIAAWWWELLAVLFLQRRWATRMEVICFCLHLEVVGQSDCGWIGFSFETRAANVLLFWGRGDIFRRHWFSCSINENIYSNMFI